jgi:hypothetical protein
MVPHFDLSKLMCLMRRLKSRKHHINKAKKACRNAGGEVQDHFPEVGKMVLTLDKQKNLATEMASLNKLVR